MIASIDLISCGKHFAFNTSVHVSFTVPPCPVGIIVPVFPDEAQRS